MKKLIFFLFVFNYLYSSIKAQSNEHHDNLFIGLGGGIYRGNPLSVDIKWMRPKKLSFMLQVYTYSYNEPRILTNNLISNEFKTNGFSLKPGIIPLHYNNESYNAYLGLQAVISANDQQLSLYYNDAFGEQKRTYNQTNITYGFELTGGIHCKLGSHFYLETGLKVGIKPSHVTFQNKEVPNYNSYYNYAPSQGFGKSFLYPNILLGLGYYLN